MKPVTVDQVQHVARVLGKHSASAAALRTAQPDALFFLDQAQGTLVVKSAGGTEIFQTERK